MLITSLPYLYGWWLSTPAMQFSGHILGVEDANTYLAKMRLGAQGSWLFYLLYTPEPHQGAWLYTFYLVLGKVARLVHLPFSLVYHLARLVFGLGLLLTVYNFIAYFVRDIAQRRLAFLLAATGGGLGWLVVILQLTPLVGLPLDWYVPEGFIFLVLFHLPHLALAESLLFWSLLFTLHSWETHTWGPAIWAGLALLGMALITAFYIGVYGVVLGLTWLAFTSTAKSWRQTWTLLAKMALALLIALPILLYDVYIFNYNPVFKVWSQQNLILSPEPWHYLLAYGLLILPAWYGARLWWQSYSNNPYTRRILLLIIWGLSFPILVYLPFNLQRRLVVGVQVALVILATYGLFQWWQQRLRPVRQRLLQVGLLFLLSLTNIFILGGSLAAVAARQAPIFVPGSQLEAMAWLAQRAQGEVVLAVYESGNLLPAYANVRALVGHGPETVNPDQKQALAKQFFNRATTDTWRRELLATYQIRYVYYGPHERAAGDFEPSRAAYLRQLYQNGDVQIFEVD